jgi:hypothetical protein
VPDVADLNNHHRETLRKVFTHPSSGNVEWRQVLSLLEAVGTVTDEPNGKVRITVGAESETFPRPRHKDVDEELLSRLRQLLTGAGLSPG